MSLNILKQCTAFTTIHTVLPNSNSFSIIRKHKCCYYTKTKEENVIMKMSNKEKGKDGKEWDELDFDHVVERYFDADDEEGVEHQQQQQEEQELEIDDERWMMEFLGDLEELDEQEIVLEEKDIVDAHNILLDVLEQGVVPADAGVGSKNLPGDYGFDPFKLATRDYIVSLQRALLRILPGSSPSLDGDDDGDADDDADVTRPQGLILRDYREAEIRHGRLAMLAAVIWPLQEIIDHLFIPIPSKDFTMVYGGTTLPFLSLLMTLFMLLLGYLDIYAQSIKQEDTGEAFLPGECFWDPLSVLDGSSQPMQLHMQSIELTNGRFAMIAVFTYILQEAIFHQSLITLPWNMFFFQPFFTIPEIQYWLDLQFSTSSPIFRDADTGFDFMQFALGLEKTS